MSEQTQQTPHHETRVSGFRLKRLLQLAIILIVAIVVVIWLVSWLQHRFTHVSASDAHVASNVVTVSSRLSGRVMAFDLIAGDKLSKGEQVAQLYAKPEKLKLQQIEARITSIKTRLHLTQRQIGSGIKLAKAMLAADTAAMHAAKTRMEKAQNNYQRAQKLHQVNAGTEKQLDNLRYTYQAARDDYKKAQSRVQQDKIAVTSARTGLLPGGKISNPEVLGTQLKQAKAERAHQLNLISDLSVKSPINGVVDKVFIDEGEYVSPGQPILMMHNPGDVWIEAHIKETAIAELAVGQPVAIHVDAWPDTTYQGHVQVIGQAATNQFALLPNPNPSGNFTKITQRIPVRIAIDQGPLLKLSPGMMVEVDIDITHNGNAENTTRQTAAKRHTATSAH